MNHRKDEMSADLDKTYDSDSAIAPDDWNGKCVFCGEDELEGGSNGGTCKYCGGFTFPPVRRED